MPPTSPPPDVDVDTGEVIDVQPTQTSDLANMPRDLAVIKMQNDQMFAIAKTKPRVWSVVLNDLKSQLQAFHEFAKGAMYSKPVGKDRDSNKMKYARGLSIRAAEGLDAAMGSTGLSLDEEPLGPDAVKLRVSYMDYAALRTWTLSRIVSRNYTDYQKNVRRHGDDRFYNVVLKAEASKLIRDAILRMVPPGLKAELERVADEKLDEFITKETAAKTIESFATIGVTRQQLIDHVGKAPDNWLFEDRKNLVGVWQAIKQGEIKAEEAFAAAPAANGEPPGDLGAEGLKNRLGKRFDETRPPGSDTGVASAAPAQEAGEPPPKERQGAAGVEEAKPASQEHPAAPPPEPQKPGQGEMFAPEPGVPPACTDGDAQIIYDHYPRKTGKQHALPAVKAAVGRIVAANPKDGYKAAVTWLVERVEAYANSSKNLPREDLATCQAWMNDEWYKHIKPPE